MLTVAVWPHNEDPAKSAAARLSTALFALAGLRPGTGMPIGFPAGSPQMAGAIAPKKAIRF